MFASIVFIAIGIVLVIYSCPPGRGSLIESQAKIVRIVSYPGTRYNVELRTTDGLVLTCVENSLDKWPPSTIDRCPIQNFRPYVGQSVEVLHNRKYIYEAKIKKQNHSFI